MNTNITPEIAHDSIVKSFGKDGFYTLNSYYDMRSVILFGTKPTGYVPQIEKLLPGKVIEDALNLMGGDLVIAIHRAQFRHYRCRKIVKGWGLFVGKFGKGGYVRGDVGISIMNKYYDTLDDALKVISDNTEVIKGIIDQKFYVTGDKDAVDEVAKLFDNPICFYN